MKPNILKTRLFFTLLFFIGVMQANEHVDNGYLNDTPIGMIQAPALAPQCIEPEDAYRVALFTAIVNSLFSACPDPDNKTKVTYIAKHFDIDADSTEKCNLLDYPTSTEDAYKTLLFAVVAEGPRRITEQKRDRLKEFTYIVKRLGVDINATNSSSKCNALHYLLSNNRYNDGYGEPYGKPIIDRFHKLGGKCDAPDKRGITPLMCAAERCNSEAITRLLKYGADPKTKSKDGNTPLHYILFTKPRLEHDRKLISWSDDIDDEDLEPIITFMTGDKKNTLGQCIDLLIVNGANVNAQNKEEQTALMACMKHISDAEGEFPDVFIGEAKLLKNMFIRIAKRLIACGANPHLKTKEGKTAIDMATNEWKKQLNNAPRVPVLKALTLNCCYKNKINIPSYYPKLLLKYPDLERHMRNDKKAFNTNFAQQKRKK